jgi:hypothetical protein
LGLRDFSEIKRGCREYEDYMAAFYDLKIAKGAEKKASSRPHGSRLTPLERKNPLHTVKAIFMS